MISKSYYIHTNEIPGEIFAQKHDIFTCEKLFSHVKRSPLLRQHNLLHLSQQKKFK